MYTLQVRNQADSHSPEQRLFHFYIMREVYVIFTIISYKFYVEISNSMCSLIHIFTLRSAVMSYRNMNLVMFQLKIDMTHPELITDELCINNQYYSKYIATMYPKTCSTRAANSQSTKVSLYIEKLIETTPICAYTIRWSFSLLRTTMATRLDRTMGSSSLQIQCLLIHLLDKQTEPTLQLHAVVNLRPYFFITTGVVNISSLQTSSHRKKCLMICGKCI
ncbi:hypothetical protein H8356DRAFT_1363248 [Neocallimastix lanati (nom. inval.)]|nr:hypothetical protein H8356DRAFT_1363248 [Neocallimastix sp. JGI-2020a]